MPLKVLAHQAIGEVTKEKRDVRRVNISQANFSVHRVRVRVAITT